MKALNGHDEIANRSRGSTGNRSSGPGESALPVDVHPAVAARKSPAFFRKSRLESGGMESSLKEISRHPEDNALSRWAHDLFEGQILPLKGEERPRRGRKGDVLLVANSLVSAAQLGTWGSPP